MTALVRFLFLVPVGYVIAVVTAASVIVFGALGYPDREFVGFFAGAVMATTLYVGAASFGPAAIAIAISEFFRLSSVFYFLAVGGAIGLVAHEVAGFIGWAEFLERRQLLYAAAGFVGGFVYWLIAGTSVGAARRV